MIRHVVLFKLIPDADPVEVETWLARLREIPANIDFVRAFSVGRDQLHLPRSYDVAVVADLDTLDDVRRYGPHPFHLPINEMSAKLCQHICSVDFEV